MLFPFRTHSAPFWLVKMLSNFLLLRILEVSVFSVNIVDLEAEIAQKIPFSSKMAIP